MSSSLDSFLSVASLVRPLPAGSAAGSFVLQHAISWDRFCLRYTARSSASSATVIIEEFAPDFVSERRTDGTLAPRMPAYESLWAEGLGAFLDESARFEHPVHASLQRIGPAWAASGGAFRLHEASPGCTIAQRLQAISEPAAAAGLRGVLGVVLDALQALHAAGAVHGNVRPDTIVLQADGTPALVDPAGVRLAIGSRLPQPIPWPEPAFVAPELTDPRSALAVGPWSDVYALAAVWRSCLVDGQRTAGRTAGSLPPPAVDGTSGALAGAIARAMAADPHDRTRSMAEFRRDLEASASRSSASKTRPTQLSAIPVLHPTPAVASAGWPRSAQQTPAREPASDWSPYVAGRTPSIAAGPPFRHEAAGPPRRRWPAAATGLVVGVVVTLVAVSLTRPLPAVSLTRPLPAVSSLWTDPAAATSPDAVSAAPPSLAQSTLALNSSPPPAAESSPAHVVRGIGATLAPAEVAEPQPPPSEATSGFVPPAVPIMLAEAASAADPPQPVVAPVAAKPADASPVALCAPRANFALYFCVSSWCQKPSFVKHPQCIRLRETGEVP